MCADQVSEEWSQGDSEGLEFVLLYLLQVPSEVNAMTIRSQDLKITNGYQTFTHGRDSCGMETENKAVRRTSSLSHSHADAGGPPRGNEAIYTVVDRASYCYCVHLQWCIIPSSQVSMPYR